MARTTTIERNNGRGRGRPSISRSEDVSEVGRPLAPQDAISGRAAFMRIAEGRINGILEKLNTLSKLSSGKSKYGYTDKDVEHIRATLIQAVNAACDRLRRKPVKDGFKFAREEEDGASV